MGFNKKILGDLFLKDNCFALPFLVLEIEIKP